jgi:hypothetical protein
MGDGVRGGFTVKPMNFKLQGPFKGPGRGPSFVFVWSYIFEKFAEVGYLNHN